jgi:hypothetical protein
MTLCFVRRGGSLRPRNVWRKVRNVYCKAQNVYRKAQNVCCKASIYPKGSSTCTTLRPCLILGVTYTQARASSSPWQAIHMKNWR